MCPCHLVHSLVRHRHPAAPRPLCERVEGPHQRHGEPTSHSLTLLRPAWGETLGEALSLAAGISMHMFILKSA